MDGAFGDTFFTKPYVSSEADATKTRSDIQVMACNACVHIALVECVALVVCVAVVIWVALSFAEIDDLMQAF